MVQLLKDHLFEVNEETSESVWNKVADLNTVRKFFHIHRLILSKSGGTKSQLDRGKPKGLFNANLSSKPKPNSKEKF